MNKPPNHSHPNHPPPPHRQPPPPHRPPHHHPHRPPPPHHPHRPPPHHPPPHRPPHHHHPPPPPSQWPDHPPPQHRPPAPSHTHRPPKPPKGGRTTLASCIVATIFLIFLIIILFIIYFSLFKPKDPKISVTAVQLPTFSLSSNSTPAVSFTFSLYASVINSNRAAFSHFDSSLQLLYTGNQVGFMFIPAGKIDAGRTKYMAATFSVQSFPVSNTPGERFPAPLIGGVNRVSPTMELEVRMEMEGRVRVLWFFNHDVKDVADCIVAVAITDGSVLGFHC